MGKTSTLNLRMNPSLKKEVETILSRLGIPVSVAVDMYFNQIVIQGGIPFSPTLPKPSADIDVSQMNEETFHAKIQKGYDDYKSGRTKNAKDAFIDFERKHG